MKALSNAETVAVAKALLNGFREEYQFEQLIATAADLDLAVDVGRGLALLDCAQKIVRLTEAQGNTEMLLREAVSQRPNNPVIRDLAVRYGLAPPPLFNVRELATTLRVAPAALVRGLVQPTLETPADIGAYEATVLRAAGSVKPGDWRRQMLERESPICQILFRGDAIGTGFLVGNNRVMSNWHVFESTPTSGQLGALADYSVRFDFRAAEGRAPALPGIVVATNAAKGYLASSEKAAYDYVLVELVRNAGEDVVDSAGRRRGWLCPSARSLKELEPVLVLQHPKGRTLELAIGPVTGWVDDRKDEIYQHWANTDEGSSGSPCFSVKWELAALHHRADPKGGPRPNRAIAMTAVVADMLAQGTAGLLPPLE